VKCFSEEVHRKVNQTTTTTTTTITTCALKVHSRFSAIFLSGLHRKKSFNVANGGVV